MTRRSSKRYSRKHFIKTKEKTDYFLRDLKKLEEEIHKDQETTENNEDGDYNQD